MQRQLILLTLGLAGFWLTSSAACGGDGDNKNTPTVASASSGGPSGSTTSGNGGSGGNGNGGNGGSATSASGGQGGMGEQPVNDCLSTSTQDMTGMASINLTNPLSSPRCITVSQGTSINIDGTSTPGGPLIVGGTFEMGVKSYDKNSPIQPACYDCQTFTACWEPNTPACYAASTWTFSSPGAFPFYDNSAPQANHGVVYVVP
jgi:hypothetical protein